MSIHETIRADIARAIEEHEGEAVLTATSIADALQRAYATAPIPDAIRYASFEHLKQMARKELAGRFEPDQAAEGDTTGELFSTHLQVRYPIPRKAGDDPVYKRRELLTEFERKWNVERMRKTGRSLLRHADALEAEALEPAGS